MFGFEMLKSQKIFQIFPFTFSGAEEGVGGDEFFRSFGKDICKHFGRFTWEVLSEGLNGLPVLRVVGSPLSKGYTESQRKILIGIPVGMQEYNHDSPFFSLSMIILSSKC